MYLTRSKSFRSSPLFLLAIVFVTAGWQGGCATAERPNADVSIEGQLVDREGRPVSQHPINLERMDGAGTAAVAFTDFSGTFQFFNLEPGKYKIFLPKGSSDQARVVELKGGPLAEKIVLTLSNEVKVDLNPQAAEAINPEAKKVINPEAAQTVNPEAARTLNSQAAKTLNPEAAKTLNPEAARTINEQAAKTINSEAAKTINPEAAKVLNPERAKTLTKEQARTITAAEASKPLPKM